ncbi:MAG: hypothetical protein C5B44_06740 [Acidobacteria bacterium]|nr:MAG: hypothetical protein C5B44_06740 [Acidobacteriota bacterium]
MILYARWAQAWPNFVVPPGELRRTVEAAVNKYLRGSGTQNTPSEGEIRHFVENLQGPDIYLSLGCALGDENAWWQFDRHHRAFIESVANQVVSSGLDANEVIESVYSELLGSKTESGIRQSKFRTYMGRGTLRGWLRTMIWHTAVDLHRSRHHEVPLEDWSAASEEVRERQIHTADADAHENMMLSKLMRERYSSATLEALDRSLAALDDHETLLLLYYHVEGLKLRQIARIVEEPRSAIRRWFQRQSRQAANATHKRVHESTIMRWLEKVYRKIFQSFKHELANKHGLSSAEIDICLELATKDLAQTVKLKPVSADEQIKKKEERE